MKDLEVAKAVHLLNKIVEYELAGVVRYTHYALMVSGPNRIPIVDFMKAQAAESLLHAQQATPDGGVAQSYNVLTNNWNPSYPETTGYIICSLLRVADAGLGDVGALHQAIVRMGDWLVDVQMPCGAIQGGHIAIHDPQPAIFNTGQVLKGWTDLIAHGLDRHGKYALSAQRSVQWLIDMQDTDGAWRKNISNHVTEPVQTYNVRTAWAMIRYGKQFDNPDAVASGVRNAEWLISIQDDQDWFPQMNFYVDRNPLTHTVAYTIQGLLEIGLLSGRQDFIDTAARVAGRMQAIQNPISGAVPGEVAPGYVPAVSWTTCTGNSQMAVIWFRLAELMGDESWIAAAQGANRFNKSLHEIDHPNPGRRGALRGSYPGHLGYCRFSYTNWTQKFFLDALLAEMGIRIV